jgi:hypothetical protein
VCYPAICKANWGCWVKDFRQTSELRTRLGKGSGASVLVEDLLGVGPSVWKGVGRDGMRLDSLSIEAYSIVLEDNSR